MPRRKNTDGEAGTNNSGPIKQPRVRKKKEPSSICSTPTAEHPPGGMKLEASHSMAGMPCGPMDGQLGHGMLGGIPPGMHMQHPGLPNGVPCGPGGHPQMMEEASNGPVGMGLPYGGGPPHPHQGPPFDFYQQGPAGSGAPPHFAPPPMPIYSGGAPPGAAQMMMQHQQQQQQGGQPPQMGPNPGGGPGQFHPGPEQEQPHPQQIQQMMPPMHAHHPGAQPGPGPMSVPPGPQMPPPPHPMFPPGAFPRQPPGPLMLLPPPSIPQPPFLEFRLQEMNRRLYQFHCQFYQQAPSEHHEQWWDAFSQEFFDDMGRMTLCMHEYTAEQGGGFVPKQYTISRRYIPRFYRSMFTHGVSSLHYIMRSPAQEMIEPQRMQNPEMFGSCALNCENLLMVSSLDKPMMAEVHIECRLYVEFAPFNPTLGYRIRHWFMELRSHREYFGKEGMQQLDGLERKLQITSHGLPVQTHTDLRMWQIVGKMEPIMERSKETNEPPQLALHQIVMENGQRMEIERQQRLAQAAAVAHIQTPPHNQLGGGPQGVPGQHPMAAMMGGMGPPQLPPGMPGMPPGMAHPAQMHGAPMGGAPQQQPPIEEQKPKPKRVRQRKTAAQQAAAAAAGGTATVGATTTNNSPPKSKKGGGQAGQQGGGQQTPPAGIPQMPPGFPPMGGPPPQFHQTGMPPGQYHQEVLTVGEPSMMGCEYGEQDERQISRVENTAFTGMSHPAGGLMLPPSAGINLPGPSAGPQMAMAAPGQQRMVENAHSLLGDFDMHSQQQQQPPPQMLPPNSMWGQPAPSDSSQQQAMSSGS